MKFFHKLHTASDWGVLGIRLAVGAIFLYHGVQKWDLWNLTAMPPGMTENTFVLMKFLSIVEPLGGIALIFGFLTQLAALGLSFIMLGAIFWIKMQVMKVGFASMTTTGWEFDLALLASTVFLFFHGAGKIALDHMLWKKEH